MEKVQVKVKRLIFPKVCTKYQTITRENKSVCERMAELLWNSKHERKYRNNQLVAVSSDPDVHLETMEETKNEGKKPKKDGNPKEICTYGSKQPKRALV